MTGDARMPRPNNAYNLLVGLPVTGLTVLRWWSCALKGP